MDRCTKKQGKVSTVPAFHAPRELHGTIVTRCDLIVANLALARLVVEIGLMPLPGTLGNIRSMLFFSFLF